MWPAAPVQVNPVLTTRPVFDAARRARVEFLSDARRPDPIPTAESERGVKPSA